MARDQAMVEQHCRTPLTTADLDVAEQFVLWALRTRLEGAAKHVVWRKASATRATARRAARRGGRSSRGSRSWPRTAAAISTSIARLVRV
jgi:hypothetical protein